MLRQVNIIFFAILLAIVVGHSPLVDDAWAKPKKKSKAVPCPEYIADKSTGMVTKSATGHYKCFTKKKKAKKAGFETLSQLQQFDYTGWWRTRLNGVTVDTCDNQPDFSGPVQFVQISQNNGAVHSEMCPSSGLLEGHRTDNGFVTSRKDVVKVPASTNYLGCADDEVERTQHFEISKIVSGSAAYAAKYVTIYHCPLPEESDRSCIVSHSGVAFLETHPIWPPVSQSTDTFCAGCATALEKCADCHQDLTITMPSCS